LHKQIDRFILFMDTVTSKLPPSNNVKTTIISFVAFTFIGYVTIGLTLAVLPVFIHDQLGFSALTAGVVISLQYVTTFLCRGFAGNIVDKKGPRLSVLIGMIAFAISGLLLFVAWLLKDHPALSLSVLVCTRLMTGIGEGFIGASPINWAILATDESHMGKAISFNGIASYGGIAVGAPLGVALQDISGLHIISLLILLLAFTGWMFAKRKPDLRATSDVPRQSFINVFKTVLPFGVSLALGGIGFGAISTFITLYFSFLHWSGAVICLSLFSSMFIIGRLLFEKQIALQGGLRVATVCFLVETAGLVLLWIANTPLVAMAGAALTGFGFSLTFPALGVEAVKTTPASSKGAALACYGLFIDLSLGATGPLVGTVAGHMGINYIYPFTTLIVFTGLVATYILQHKKQPRELAGLT